MWIRRDEEDMSNPIIEKPWGYEQILSDDGNGLVKKHLIVRGGHCLSLQYHMKRTETWVVVFGSCEIQIEDKWHKADKGTSWTIPKMAKHRVCAFENSIIEEISDLYDELDIVRLEDQYGRAGGK
jgi:mannose-6-phosphate isomerase-like protein (cupin superfamily)